MRRSALTLLSALSLLLCVALVALWVFSYFRMVAVARREQNAPVQLEVTSRVHPLAAAARTALSERPPRGPRIQVGVLPVNGRPDWGYVTHRRNIRGATSRFRAGVFEVYQLPARYGTVTTVRVPLWFLVIVTAALPLSRLWVESRSFATRITR